MDNNDEVMTADGSDFVILEGTKIVDRVIKIEQIIAEPDLIEVNPKGRKCLFTNEPQSKHFQVNISQLDHAVYKLTNSFYFNRLIPEISARLIVVSSRRRHFVSAFRFFIQLRM